MSGVEAVAYLESGTLNSAEPADLERERAIRPAEYAEWFPVYSQATVDTLRAQLEAAEARAEAAEAEIDWIKAQPDDEGRMFTEIEAAAKASYRRHRSKVRGQVITRADSYESHLVWATLEWAARTKEETK